MSSEEIVVRPTTKIKTQTNPNSLANLIPHQYKKGENGHGRVYPLKERLAHALDHPLTEPRANAPVGERIVYATLMGALKCEPSSAHLREVWERIEGKVPGDQLAGYQDNRTVNIIVSNGETKELMGKIANWTHQLTDGE